MLGLYIRQINQKLAKINELIKKFEEILQRRKFREIKNEKTYCSDNGVESEHEKKVRESVELTVEHMKRVLNNAPEREGFGRTETRKQILSLTENLTPSVVMTCLLDQTHELTRRVRRKVDEARKDCISEEDQCPMVNSVIAEVEDFNAVHFAACLEVGNRKCSVARLMERFEVECLDVDPGIVDRLQRRAEAASLRESVRIAKSVVAEKEEQSDRGQLFFELVAKQSKKVDELCDVISTLVARDHLLGTMSVQKNTSELLCNKLTTRTEQAVASVRNLTGVVALQSRTLTAASTTSLISTLVKGPNSSTLTTTERLGIYKHRDTPGLSTVVARIEAVARIRRELAELEDVGSGLQLEDRTSKLRTSLGESRRKQEAEVLPLLANTDVTRREGQDTAVRLAELHKDWVEQGAGDVAATTDLGWCEVEGRSLPRVLQDIRVLVAKYNKTIANL